MNCWESLFMYILQQQDLVIEEQKVNDLNQLYSMANVTIRYPECTTKFNVYAQFGSRHICNSNICIGLAHHIQYN